MCVVKKGPSTIILIFEFVQTATHLTCTLRTSGSFALQLTLHGALESSILFVVYRLRGCSGIQFTGTALVISVVRPHLLWQIG